MPSPFATVSQFIYLFTYFSENVGRLKKLEYLNLALNNVELIENLEGNFLYIFLLA